MVGMARGAVHSTYRSSWDLATDGSPVVGQGSGDSRNPQPPPPANAAFLAQILTQQKYIVTGCSCFSFNFSFTIPGRIDIKKSENPEIIKT